MDPRTTLLTALPLVLIITVLAAIVVFSGNLNLDIRPKAAPPIPTLTQINPYADPIQLKTQTACSGLYEPVCGQDGLTYENLCEAQNKNISVAYYSDCFARELPSTE